MKRLIVTVTVDKYSVHISRAGHAGHSFDTGENGKEIKEALRDMAEDLLESYRALEDDE